MENPLNPTLAAAQETPNHNEAWNLAHFRRAGSNLARAYIELRDLARRERLGNLSPVEDTRLSAIIHSNDI